MNSLEAFDYQVNKWQKSLKEISWPQLVAKPAEGWTLGQLYVHLLHDTAWYFAQADLCFGDTSNAAESMNKEGKRLFLNNSFPDIRIVNRGNEVPLPSNILELEEGLEQLKAKAATIFFEQNKKDAVFGKSEHPGFGYLDPLDWLQFAEMHMRHHVKQKERILLNIKK